jgi:hypothetical protein
MFAHLAYCTLSRTLIRGYYSSEKSEIGLNAELFNNTLSPALVK